MIWWFGSYDLIMYGPVLGIGLRALVLVRRAGRDDARERDGELLQPLAVGLGQVERDGARRVVADRRRP